MQMNLRHIEIFHAVYQAGSISAAARALNVSQPSISKVLRHAESRIGFVLFRLVKGRLVPTEEAHLLFREARELQARIESLHETTRNLQRGGEGLLRLAVLPALGLDVAPAAVAEFGRRHADIAFDIQTLHHDDVLRSLYERNSDLAVSYDPPLHPRLSAIPVGSGELVALYRRADLPDAPARITLDSLAHRPLIRLTGSGFVGSLFTQQIEAEQPARASIAVQTYYVAAALVRHGAGFAVVDEYTAQASLDDAVDFRPIVGAPRFTVYCAHLEDQPLSRLARAFVAVLQEVLQRTRT